MNTTLLQSCHLGPGISPEQVTPEHFFLYLLTGSMVVYNGDKHYEINPGDYGLARKNHLLRYTKHPGDGNFRTIVVAFDEPFLRRFLKKHPFQIGIAGNDDSILFIRENRLLSSFIQSLKPYYLGSSEIDETFAELKREELLLILLKQDPGLAAILFNFGAPQKIDLKAFMNRNFRFNVSLERFAFLTGRSLSSFKRDFQQLFNDTPGHWLTKKRLEEAYFLIYKQSRKPKDIYMELGFEDLSHFSFAFKKQFGHAPTAGL
ncbi:helix-turn-helix domain-containing protein [Pedobacter metabolipauper]|uniref:AraC-like DNA-binding protein n=1 Tax=Pedobacter metabolipauper TaxID=425513 RepID=A0A4R6SUK8_9SPHI|nr:AraC family transcriptional regulator [Pedobacter metabolipauper]TDQ08109.1 AraC-like DNA-binding protein [Pedobacter metabolipauper]